MPPKHVEVAERCIDQMTELEHVKSKSMWTGSHELQTKNMHIVRDNVFILEPIDFPPALYKIVDEVLVNAIDHYKVFPNKVKHIYVTLDKVGRITIRNDGPGMPITQQKSLAKDIMTWTPQLLATEFRVGDNLRVSDNIKGGTNGLGLKIATAYSEEVILDIQNRNKNYVQYILNGMGEIKEPVIIDRVAADYTSISILPRYKDFAVDYSKEFSSGWKKLLEARAYHAAASTGVIVSFNGKPISLTWQTYCEMYKSDVYTCNLIGDYVWNIGIGVSDGKFEHATQVNGVVVSDGGSYVNFLRDKLVTELSEILTVETKGISKIKPNQIYNRITLIANCTIPDPGFESQSKDKVSDKSSKYKSYNFSSDQIKKIWELLREHILEQFIKTVKKVTTKSISGDVSVPKYIGAKRCVKESVKCTLTIVEGDSAQGMTSKGIDDPALQSETVNSDYYGSFSCQGIVANAEKQSIDLDPKKAVVDEDPTCINDHVIPKKLSVRIPSDKLKKNGRLNDLILVLNLDYNCHYNFTPEGNAQFKTLRYGAIMCMMDQDLDGFNIFGLLCTFFLTYWPNLLARDYVRRLSTPVIRVYQNASSKSKGLIGSFYSVQEADEWLAENPGRYCVRYFKGLGSHDGPRGEIREIFRSLEDHIVTVVHDKDAQIIKDAYYGKLTNERKRLLCQPQSMIQCKSQRLTVSEIFNSDIYAAQKYNISRKLLCYQDGLNTARRKILYTMLVEGKDDKVGTLAGSVITLTDYAHGPASLENTIITMAQGYPMSIGIPLLTPSGNFGTFKRGYKDAASPRYIYSSLHGRLANKLFRDADMDILEYVQSEGRRVEPKCFAPILPMVLMNNYTLPATGWKISIFAREIRRVIDNVKRMIVGEAPLPMEYWKNGYTGDVYENGLHIQFVGKYELYNNSTLEIKSLALDKWPNVYCCGEERTGSRESKKKEQEQGVVGLMAIEGVKSFINNSNDNTYSVNIAVNFEHDVTLEQIKESLRKSEKVDGIHDHFKLHKSTAAALNLLDANDNLLEYDSYEDILQDWFVFRKRMYKKRVERQLIFAKLRLQYLQNIQRFTDNYEKYNIGRTTKESDVEDLFEADAIEKFVKGVMGRVPRIATGDLIEYFTGADASYGYLLDLRISDLCQGEYNKRNVKISEYHEEIADLSRKEPYLGAHIWQREIAEFEKEVDQYEADGNCWFPQDIDDDEPIKKLQPKPRAKRLPKK